MRNLTLVLPAAAALALSACASAEQAGAYADQERALAENCAARGGILVPREGHHTGRPQADNICKITGGATRLDED